MHARIEQFLQQQLKQPKSADNLRSNLTKTYSRVFDNMDILENKMRNTLAKQLIGLVTVFSNGAAAENGVPGFKKIAHKKPSEFQPLLNRLSRAEPAVYGNLLPALYLYFAEAAQSEINQRAIKQLAEQLIVQACSELLDGRGNLRWHMIETLGLNQSMEKSKAVRHPRVIYDFLMAFYASALAQLTAYISTHSAFDNTDTIGFQQALAAVTQAFQKFATYEMVQQCIQATQKPEYTQQFAERFVTALIQCAPDNSFDQGTLQNIVDAGFEKRNTDVANLRPLTKNAMEHIQTKRFLFWLTVLYQLAVIKKEYFAFKIIYIALEKQFLLSNAQLQHTFSDDQWRLAHPDKANLLAVCQDEWEKHKSKTVEEIKPCDSMNLIATLQPLVEAATTAITVDLLVTMYVDPLHSQRQRIAMRPLAESIIINELLTHIDSDAILQADQTTPAILTAALRRLCAMRKQQVENAGAHYKLELLLTAIRMAFKPASEIDLSLSPASLSSKSSSSNSSGSSYQASSCHDLPSYFSSSSNKDESLKTSSTHPQSNSLSESDRITFEPVLNSAATLPQPLSTLPTSTDDSMAAANARFYHLNRTLESGMTQSSSSFYQHVHRPSAASDSQYCENEQKQPERSFAQHEQSDSEGSYTDSEYSSSERESELRRRGHFISEENDKSNSDENFTDSNSSSSENEPRKSGFSFSKGK